VAAGSTSATFVVTAGTITGTQAATVTATLSGASKIATVNLVATAALSSLACTPTSLASQTTSTCTVTLTAAAPAGGSLITLSDNSSLVTTPASVTVAAGSTSAAFVVTAGTITGTQTGTVTATLNGVSNSVTLNLAASTLSSLNCSSSSVVSGETISCTVTLVMAAPSGGTLISVAHRNSPLTMPASVTVAAGQTSAKFNLTAGTITTTRSVKLTLTLNGASESVTLDLIN
jgi:hypothetical protein